MTEEEFGRMFPDEESCIAYLKQQRESLGNACPKCGCTDSFFDNTNRCWSYKCGHVRTLRSGTVMQASKLPYRTWLKAIYHMSSPDVILSAREMKDKLGIGTPNHVRIVQMRIRDAMSGYLVENGIGRSVDGKTMSGINFIYKGVAEENRQYYVDEYIYRHLPENAGDACFGNLVKVCLSYTTDVKLKR